MTKLTDTQTILLSTASQRADGNLLPLPATVRPGGGTAKAMVSLARRGLAEELYAAEGDETPCGVFLIATGAAAIGVDLPEQEDDADEGNRRSLPYPCPACTSTREAAFQGRHDAGHASAAGRRHAGGADRSHRLAAAHHAWR